MQQNKTRAYRLVCCGGGVNIALRLVYCLAVQIVGPWWFVTLQFCNVITLETYDIELLFSHLWTVLRLYFFSF